MCGIAGLLTTDGTPASQDLVRTMAQAIAHRGPDGDGTFVDGPIALGHRRLAIVDLSDAGRQPMESADGRYVISYNGEVYNFKVLRAELEASGRVFRSGTDTEVVLEAFAAWGEKAIERFDGMFAFAIWDRQQRRLTLARDRYGIKPLYYSAHGGIFRFASEIKAILADPTVARRVDLFALREYFTFQNILSERTLFEGIRILAPAHILTITPGGEPKARRYWDFRFDDKLDAQEAAHAPERVRELFEQAVQRQLVTDVPLGAHLSSGMDSGSIAAVASHHVPRLPTFTGGFDTREVDGFEIHADERDGAEALSSMLRTEHYEMVMHAGDMRWVLPRLVWHLEDLRLGMCWQNYYIERLASRFVKVALTGTAGDELFGGYPWRYAMVMDAKDDETFDATYLAYWQRLIPEQMHTQLFRPEVMEATSSYSAHDAYRKIFDGAQQVPDAPLDKALYFELKTFLHGLLVISDKLSMAHGLETRVPFLDNDLVDYALRIPGTLKVGPLPKVAPGVKIRSNAGKRVLRDAMRGLLPDEVLEREKHGFTAPDGSWYRGPSLVYVHETLLGPESRCTEFLAPSFIKRLIAEHWTRNSEHRLLLWSLLSFEWWLRVFDLETPDHTKLETSHESDSAPVVKRRARRVRSVSGHPTKRAPVPFVALADVPPGTA